MAYFPFVFVFCYMLLARLLVCLHLFCFVLFFSWGGGGICLFALRLSNMPVCLMDGSGETNVHCNTQEEAAGQMCCLTHLLCTDTWPTRPDTVCITSGSVVTTLSMVRSVVL